MKTLAALSLFLLAIGTGCAATPSDDGGNASSEAVTGTNFDDVSPGGKTAMELLTTKPISSMTIAGKATWAKAWRFDMSAKGFTVTGIDAQGSESTTYAFAIEKVNGKMALTGIASSYTYTTVEQLRAVIGDIRSDFADAQKNIPDVEDPGMSTDPQDWSPTSAHCSARTSFIIGAAMNLGVVVDVASVVMMATGVAAPIALFTMGVGAALMLGGQQADHDLCGNGSGAF